MNRLSLSAEENVLGALMIDPEAYHKVSGVIRESDFTTDKNRKLYQAITKQAEDGKPHDTVTIGELIGDVTAAGQIAIQTMSAGNVTHYAEMVRERAQKHQVVDVLRQAIESAQSAPLLDLVAEVQGRLESLTHRTTGEGRTFAEAMTAAVESIDQAYMAKLKGGCAGIPTGIPCIDQWIGGLQALKLIILAARPSIGKTALANQVAFHAASLGYPVGILSLEMGPDELAIRAMANRYQLNGTALAFGDEAQMDELAKKQAENPINSYPVWIDADTFSLSAIVSRLTEWKRKYDIQLAVVDHIGLIEVDGAISANERLGKVTRTLKKTAKRLGIALIAVSQLNRSVEKEKRWPTLADLRDSGSIEQDADICIFLHVDADNENNRYIPMHIGLLKNRGGRKGWQNDRVIFNGSTQTFYQDGKWQ